MSTGLWIAVAAVVVALAFGGYRTLADGRFRGTRRIGDARIPAGPRRRFAHRDLTEPQPRGSGATGRTYDDGLWDAVVAAAPEAAAGRRATLVQFSSAFCAPCRATRRVLDDVAGRVPGVTHVEVDAEAHLELVRRLGVLRTPTTIVLDGSGREVARAAGAPRVEQVLAALPGEPA